MSKLSFDKRLVLYYDEYESYVIEFIKEVIPRQLASLYKYDLIIDEALKQYVNSICDVLNVRVEFSSIRKDVEEILKSKYNLVIVNDNPLKMESIK